MQWNTANMSKEELKKRQEEFIKAAIEMSKKSKWKDEAPVLVPVIVTVPEENKDLNYSDETTVNEISQSNVEVKEEENLQVKDTIKEAVTMGTLSAEDEKKINESTTDTEIETIASKEFEADEAVTHSPEEIFASVFITEEEAEEKLKEAEKTIEAFSDDIPDFNKYIESHNKKTDSTKTADE